MVVLIPPNIYFVCALINLNSLLYLIMLCWLSFASKCPSTMVPSLVITLKIVGREYSSLSFLSHCSLIVLIGAEHLGVLVSEFIKSLIQRTSTYLFFVVSFAADFFTCWGWAEYSRSTCFFHWWWLFIGCLCCWRLAIWGTHIHHIFYELNINLLSSGQVLVNFTALKIMK